MSEAQEKVHSLRRQLLQWLAVPLLAYLVIDGWWTFIESQRTATHVRDSLLMGAARFVAGQVRFEEDAFWAYVPPAALDLLQTDRSNPPPRQGSLDTGILFAVYGPDGKLIAGSQALRPYVGFLNPGETVLYETKVADQYVRVAALNHLLYQSPSLPPVLVLVAEPVQVRRSLVRRIWGASFQREVFMVGLLFSIVLITSKRGVRSVLELRDRVLAREPGSLEPMVPMAFPTELQPLVEAVNDYIHRLDAHMTAHSRFISNAAHQLRTPLAILQTQVSYCLKSGSMEVKDETMLAIRESLKNYARVVNQLMAFSTAETHHQQPRQDHTTDLSEAARRVLVQWSGHAQGKSIDLGFDGPDQPLMVRGNPSLVFELVANLVDNAIRYSPAHGIVTVRLKRKGAEVLLQVEDNGPGIPPKDRTRVFERFVRLHDGCGDGCGLGLSIVREIAHSLEARVDLSEPPSGRGLLAQVYFPLH